VPDLFDLLCNLLPLVKYIVLKLGESFSDMFIEFMEGVGKNSDDL
jgi:hypothetical protein